MCNGLIRKHPWLLFLLYFPVYLIAFFSIDTLETEHFIIHFAADALIPFNEYFILIYALWFVWFPGVVFFFTYETLRPDILRPGMAEFSAAGKEAREALRDYLALCTVMFTAMTLCLLIYLIWPNGIDLREEITSDDFCARLVMLIRAADTPYGVCPSIHIATITVEAAVILRSRLRILTRERKAAACIITLLIAYSTLAVKQHSIVDVVSGALLAVLLYILYEKWVGKYIEKGFGYAVS